MESRVRLLFNLEDDVSGLDARKLVTLTAELDPVAGLDAAVDVDMKDLALDDGFLAVALLTPVAVANDLALALAVGADGLEALDHRTHLPHHVLHAPTLTAGTFLHSTLFSAAAVALGANDGFLKGELGHFTAVDVLERHLVDMGDCPRLLWAGIPHATAEHAAEWATTASEELCEEVLGGHAAAAHTTLLKTLLTILVVYRALVAVGQNLVSM